MVYYKAPCVKAQNLAVVKRYRNLYEVCVACHAVVVVGKVYRAHVVVAFIVGCLHALYAEAFKIRLRILLCLLGGYLGR